jgi:ATP-dependent DNA helicase RecG
MSDEEVQLANFNERQINAISYLRRNKKITKKEYQKLNQTTHDCTKKDLNQLLRKKKLKKYGSGKSTYYKLS